MKNLLSMLLVFSFLFTIGCEDDDATESNPLVGVWNMTSIVIESEGTTTIDADDDFNGIGGTGIFGLALLALPGIGLAFGDDDGADFDAVGVVFDAVG